MRTTYIADDDNVPRCWNPDILITLHCTRGTILHSASPSQGLVASCWWIKDQKRTGKLREKAWLLEFACRRVAAAPSKSDCTLPHRRWPAVA
ncbi:hypothetical protein A9K55_008815 [Cordyceps militaris]|uniref:Uncharacterized protein n=1 Tax=Cordyceps militaris TaxID=73501 RepID=A0A2H4SIU5_CORMI|nr:hypothetical protein A9K55_008815 [Cordyceps militaris]